MLFENHQLVFPPLESSFQSAPMASEDDQTPLRSPLYDENRGWSRVLGPPFEGEGSSTNSSDSTCLLKADVAWPARTRNVSERDHLLRTVQSILNKLTPEKFDHLKTQLIKARIMSADTLMKIVSLIFENAVLAPLYCPMYAQLCLDLNEKLPRFRSGEPGGRKIYFQRVLLNHCQEAFEGANKLKEEIPQLTADGDELAQREKERKAKLRSIGNVCLILELFKQKMVSEKIVHLIALELLKLYTVEVCPGEGDVEALCVVLKTLGKKLDKYKISRCINDKYFTQLSALSTNPQLSPRLRFMILDVIELRANDWVPRREQLTPKKIWVVQREAEKDLGLRPGSTPRNSLGLVRYSKRPGVQRYELKNASWVASSSPSDFIAGSD